MAVGRGRFLICFFLIALSIPQSHQSVWSGAVQTNDCGTGGSPCSTFAATCCSVRQYCLRILISSRSIILLPLRALSLFQIYVLSLEISLLLVREQACSISQILSLAWSFKYLFDWVHCKGIHIHCCSSWNRFLFTSLAQVGGILLFMLMVPQVQMFKDWISPPFK